MELQTRSNLYLAGSCILSFIIGSLVLYLFMLDRCVIEVVEDTSDVTKNEEVTLNIAPEDYVPVTFNHSKVIELPEPELSGSKSVEAALQERRSRREYADTPLTLAELGQMLWAGQGETNEQGARTAPSSRNNYPLRLFVAVDRVEGVESGIYEYLPSTHSIGQIKDIDVKSNWDTVTGQPHPQKAAAVIIVAADMGNPAAEQPTLQESGHVGQNLYLQAESLGLGMLVMGGFESPAAQELIGIDEFERVVYLVPVGHRVEVMAE